MLYLCSHLSFHHNQHTKPIAIRMLRHGFTVGAVRAALARDGKPDIMRLDPNRAVSAQRMPRVSGRDSINMEGIEFNGEGLTEGGWETALESARKALPADSENRMRTTRTPSYRKSPSTSGEGLSSHRSDPGSNLRRKAHHRASVSVPPYLQSGVSRGVVEGWLRKRTRRGRWVRRWHLLDSTGVYYSHAPPSSSEAKGAPSKLVKLVDTRLLGAKKCHCAADTGHPGEFELWHPSQNKAVATLRAMNFHEAQQWIDAVNSAHERQRLVDEVVVGSVTMEGRGVASLRPPDLRSTDSADHTSSPADRSPSSPKRQRYAQPSPKGGTQLLTIASDDSGDSAEGIRHLEDTEGNLEDIFRKLPAERRTTALLSDSLWPPKLQRWASWPPPLSTGTLRVPDACALSSVQQEGLTTAGERSAEESVSCAGDQAVVQEAPSFNNNDNAHVNNGNDCADGVGAGEDSDRKNGLGDRGGTTGQAMSSGESDADDGEPGKAAVGDGPMLLKDDCIYAKYYKMRKMGLPKEAVQHAMTRDGLDPRYVARMAAHTSHRRSVRRVTLP